MRKLITTLLISGLLLFGCATIPTPESSILEGMMEQLEEHEIFVPEIHEGWSAKSSDGNHWDLYARQWGDLILIGSCDYQYMKIKGVEMWVGNYYLKKESFMMEENTIQQSELENLVGCVEWVIHQSLGDYLI